VTASPREHPDLFWALRGGGPSFGVVVELEFALAPIGPVVIGGMLGWPGDRACAVAARYSALMARASEDLGGGLSLLAAPPPLPFVPQALHGKPFVAIIVLWTGEPAEGDSVLAPLRELAPAVDAVAPMRYAALQAMFESPEPYTVRIHGEGGFLSGLPGELIAALAEHQAHKPVALGNLLLQPLGGRVRAHARRRDAAGSTRRALGVAGRGGVV
jgi:hypothetical protein